MNPLKPWLGALALAGASALAAPPADLPYAWKPVAIVGGGFRSNYFLRIATSDNPDGTGRHCPIDATQRSA